MTGEAGNPLLAAEILFVERVHHHHHLPRSLDARRRGGECLRVGRNPRVVAADAVEQQCGCEHPHGVVEFVDRHALEDLDVQIDLFRHRWLRWRRCLAGGNHGADQTYEHRRDGAANHLSPSKSHEVLSPAV
jgi:hypothetical protein